MLSKSEEARIAFSLELPLAVHLRTSSGAVASQGSSPLSRLGMLTMGFADL